MDEAMKEFAIAMCHEATEARSTPGVGGLVTQVVTSVQGTEWPADAVCSLRTRYSSWPVGSRDSVTYYRTWRELRQAVRGWRRFAQLEDNYVFELSVWKWDLGPHYVGDL